MAMWMTKAIAPKSEKLLKNDLVNNLGFFIIS